MISPRVLAKRSPNSSVAFVVLLVQAENFKRISFELIIPGFFPDYFASLQQLKVPKTNEFLI